jgi:hypothetical protein
VSVTIISEGIGLGGLMRHMGMPAGVVAGAWQAVIDRLSAGWPMGRRRQFGPVVGRPS